MRSADFDLRHASLLHSQFSIAGEQRSQFHHSGNPNYYRVMLCAQHQAAMFFQSDGATVIRPPSTDLWETPISLPLATDTYYLPRQR